MFIKKKSYKKMSSNQELKGVYGQQTYTQS